MWFAILFPTLFAGVFGSSSFYSFPFQVKLTNEEVVEYVANNTLANCTQKVKNCELNEGRRLDGSCYNINHPESGTVHTPLIRLLPEHFSRELDPRKSVTGDELPLVRTVRNNLLKLGKTVNPKATQLATHFGVTFVAESTTTHDTLNYIKFTTDCCTLEGKHKEVCISIKIEEDDPVHRFSEVRCMNQTRPLSHYSQGCTRNIRPFSRITNTTNQIDLGLIYYAPGQNTRTHKGGQLLVEIIDNVVLPTSNGIYRESCSGNVKEKGEIQCFGPIPANLMPVNLFIIWFWRYHNYLAVGLAKVNPCWSDEKLYQISRDINIAIFTNIFYYEWYPLFVGYDYALKKGIISESRGFRDTYDKSALPLMSLEYAYAFRSMHTHVNGEIRMYDENYDWYETQRITNLTLRVGYLANYENIAGITKSSYLEKCARSYSAVDPDMANLGLGGLQRSTDLPAFDLNKGRHFGMAPYVDYLHKCFGKKIKHWHQLKEFMDEEKIEELMMIYKDIRDVDLLAGIWIERLLNGGLIAPTAACLIDDQLLRFMKSDRHWYERENRPNAFSLDQLFEVRKVGVSSLLCAVADGVTKIQPRGFEINGPENPLLPCKAIPSINLNAWKDSSCQYKEDKKGYHDD